MGNRLPPSHAELKRPRIEANRSYLFNEIYNVRIFIHTILIPLHCLTYRELYSFNVGNRIALIGVTQRKGLMEVRRF
jgi:hypothetical protein